MFLSKYCNKADILPDLLGSDHCPIFADFKIPEDYLGPYRSIITTRGKRKTPKLSSIYLNGFSSRRSVRDMFAAASKKRTTPTLDSSSESTNETLKSSERGEIDNKASKENLLENDASQASIPKITQAESVPQPDGSDRFEPNEPSGTSITIEETFKMLPSDQQTKLINSMSNGNSDDEYPGLREAIRLSQQYSLPLAENGASQNRMEQEAAATNKAIPTEKLDNHFPSLSLPENSESAHILAQGEQLKRPSQPKPKSTTINKRAKIARQSKEDKNQTSIQSFFQPKR